MITEYNIDGYKSLRGISVRARLLNVLVGGNSCGKSSVLQALLLLRQSAKGGRELHTLQLSGGLFEAGTARDVLHPEARSGMQFGIRSSGSYSAATFSTSPGAGTDARELIASEPFRIPEALGDDSGERFVYLSAERVGPRVVYQLPMPGAVLSGPVGMHGEFAVAYLARCQQANRPGNADWFELLRKTAESMPEDLILDESARKNLVRLDLIAKQILTWIIPGTDFQTAEQSATDSAQLSYIRDPSGTKTLVRSTHMGFGVTYALPVVAGALALRENGLLLVENPEAHLHPASQSRIGVFLALVASLGVQVFLETHSDHVVNGIRLAVKSALIGAPDVKFFFFRKLPDDDTSKMTELTVSGEGRVSAWPEGFFDQIARDLSRL